MNVHEKPRAVILLEVDLSVRPESYYNYYYYYYYYYCFTSTMPCPAPSAVLCTVTTAAPEQCPALHRQQCCVPTLITITCGWAHVTPGCYVMLFKVSAAKWPTCNYAHRGRLKQAYRTITTATISCSARFHSIPCTLSLPI